LYIIVSKYIQYNPTKIFLTFFEFNFYQMGAYLSSPICEKDTIEGSNNRLAFAASSMQGWRMSQEVKYSYSL
jgi:hypothetical protein